MINTTALQVLFVVLVLVNEARIKRNTEFGRRKKMFFFASRNKDVVVSCQKNKILMYSSLLHGASMTIKHFIIQLSTVLSCPLTYVHANGHDRIIFVILAKHCIRFPDDGSPVTRNMLEHF